MVSKNEFIALRLTQSSIGVMHNFQNCLFSPDRDAQRIVSAMDELMFLFCQPGDAVITRKPFNPVHEHYLQSIGFNFERNECDLDPKNEQDKCVFQLLFESEDRSRMKPLLSDQAILEPFAVLPYVANVCESYNLQCLSPGIETGTKGEFKVLLA